MTKYMACKHRNVTAAYERFLGPDSGAWQASSSHTWTGILQVRGWLSQLAARARSERRPRA